MSSITIELAFFKINSVFVDISNDLLLFCSMINRNIRVCMMLFSASFKVKKVQKLLWCKFINK
mgnify:CR=1 FL=1